MKPDYFPFIPLFFFFFFPSTIIAQDGQQRKQLEAYKLQSNENITLDGHLNESIWDRIEVAADFRQDKPIEGAEATEQTEVRIAYDEEYLYMGVILYDSNPSEIKAFLKRRDVRPQSDERFAWIFDTFNDQRGAYFLEINPNGIRTDGLINTGATGSDSKNLNWDGIWYVKTFIGEFGWSAEIKIPFRTFNFDAESDRWGVNFERQIRRKDETVRWSGHQRNQGLERPQSAGVLMGLNGVSQGMGLEVVPFGIANIGEERLPGGGKTYSEANGGFDINYSITPSLKASVTYNTDFAEAEVDQRQVNLTRFPLEFEEQRDFFLEGANIYEFAPNNSVTPFFSRRIGLREGMQIPVTYGARILGNIGDYNLALMHVRTGNEGEVQPENFSVARVKRNIGTESTIGMIYTRRSTQESKDPASTLQDSHTLGTDLYLKTSDFMGSNNLQFQAFFVFHNSPYLVDDRTNLWDRSSRGIRLDYPNQPWAGHVTYREFGQAFDPALGFTPRNGFRRLQPSIEYTPQFPENNLFQEIKWEYHFEHLMDLDFKLLTQENRLTLFDVSFMSGDDLKLDIFRNFERLDEPFDIKRDGSIIIPMDEYVAWKIDVSVETASYRMLSTELNVVTGGFWSGKSTEYGGKLIFKPYSGISLEPEYIHTDVDLAEGSFSANLIRLVANVDLTTSINTTSTIQYDNLSKLIAMNNRLHWMITPGSDVYLVYNHNWIENPMQRFRTVQRTGVLKVSYTHRF